MKTLLVTLGLVLLAAAAPAQTPGLPQTPPVWDDIRAKQLEQDKKLDAIMARLGIPQTPPVAAVGSDGKIIATGPGGVVLDSKPVRIPLTPVVGVGQASFSGVVPAGMHAHRRTDGSVFVHGHGNHGDAAAHAGVAAPWVQIATAGQYVPPQQPVAFGAVQYGTPTFAAGPVYTAAPAFGFAAPVTSGSFSTVTRSSGSFGGDCPGGNCPNQQFGTPVRSGFRRLFN